MNDLPDAHDRADDAERSLAYVEAQLDRAMASELKLMARVQLAEGKARRLEEEAERLKALLREVEWSAREGRDLDRACPICSEWECLGRHAPDCRLKAAIG